MAYNFELEVSGAASVEDVVDALNRAAELIQQGNIEGDLRNETIEHGHFDLNTDEPTEE